MSGVGLQLEFFVGIERGQVVEEDLVAGHLGWLEVDRLDLEQGKIALALLGGPDLAGNRVAGAQVETTDLAGRDIDIIRARQIVVIRGAQKAETVLQGLQNTFAEDHAVLFGLGIQQGKDQILLAQAGCALDIELTGKGVELVDLLAFQFL